MKSRFSAFGILSGLASGPLARTYSFPILPAHLQQLVKGALDSLPAGFMPLVLLQHTMTTNTGQDMSTAWHSTAQHRGRARV